jgi:hypothetical protein
MVEQRTQAAPGETGWSPTPDAPSSDGKRDGGGQEASVVDVADLRLKDRPEGWQIEVGDEWPEPGGRRVAPASDIGRHLSLVGEGVRRDRLEEDREHAPANLGLRAKDHDPDAGPSAEVEAMALQPGLCGANVAANGRA